MRLIDQWELTVGGLPRADLLGALAARGVGLNAHAQTLLDRDDEHVWPADDRFLFRLPG